MVWIRICRASLEAAKSWYVAKIKCARSISLHSKKNIHWTNFKFQFYIKTNIRASSPISPWLKRETSVRRDEFSHDTGEPKNQSLFWRCKSNVVSFLWLSRRTFFSPKKRWGGCALCHWGSTDGAIIGFDERPNLRNSSKFSMFHKRREMLLVPYIYLMRTDLVDFDDVQNVSK